MKIKLSFGRLIMTTEKLTITIYRGLSTIKLNDSPKYGESFNLPLELESFDGAVSLFPGMFIKGIENKSLVASLTGMLLLVPVLTEQELLIISQLMGYYL